MILQNLQLESIKGLQENCSQETGQVFRSYFNVFSYARWMEYTALSSLYLALSAEGPGKVTFFNETGDAVLAADIGTEARVDIPCGLDCAVLYFTWAPRETGSRILQAAYGTDDLPRQEVRLAVDMCTYCREAFVKHNAEVIARMDGVSAYIVDNGNTLRPEEVCGEKVKLFANLNSGGSGGFARGMLEILKDREACGYTHVVLMDDDVSFLPESFTRLKALLALRKEKYRNACVSGAFLNSEVGYIQAEGGAEWPDLRTYPHILNLNLDLRAFDIVVKNEKEYHSDHAAWWFACYSLDTVREDNLPLPFFIRLDDSEYGVRAGVPVMRLNGICVWHEASENKKDSALYYYTVRNMMILNAVHGTARSGPAMFKFCVRSMLSNLLRYRYMDMALVMKAAEDFLAGPAFFETTDPAAYHQEIRSLGYRLEDVRQLTEDPEALAEVENFSREEDLKRAEKRTWKHILTLNGWLLPARWDRVYAFPLSVSQERLYRIGRAVFFDSSNGKGMVSEKKFRELFCFAGNCLRLAWMFRGYPRARDAYFAKRAYLTGSAFWRKYLRL